MVAVAVDALAPATWPRVSVAEALPLASVTDVGGIVPFVAAHETTAPMTAFWLASMTCTTSGAARAVPTVPVCASPLTRLIAAPIPLAELAWNVTVPAAPIDASTVFAPAIGPRTHDV